MKRPLAWIGLTYFLALVLTGSFDLMLSLVTAILFFLAAAAVGVYPPREERFQALRTALLAVLLTAGIGCCVSCVCRMTVLAPADALAGQEYELTGVVLDTQPEKGPYCTRLVRVEAVSGAETYNGKYLHVSGTHLYEAEIGERVRVSVRMEKLSDFYDSAACRSALAQGIRAAAVSLGEPTFPTDASPSLTIRLETTFAVWRNALAENIRAAIPGENGELAAAITVGDKSGLSKATLEAFRLTGTRHLLALSGFHLSLLVSALLSVGLFVAIPRKLWYTIVMLLVLGYMALTGFPYSLQRAGIMTLLALFASLIRRSSDPLNSLGASLLLICLLQPGAAYDVGLQLSAASTLGILLLAKPMAEPLLRRLPRPLKGKQLQTFGFRFLKSALRSLCASLAASVLSFPILVLTFGEVSLLGPLATLLIGWLLPFIMLPTLLAGLLTGLPWLCALFGWVAGLAGAFMRWIIGLLAAIPFVCIYLKHSYVLCWLVGTAAGFALLRLLRTQKATRRIFLFASAAVLLAASLMNVFLRQNTLEVAALDNTDGTGILLTEGESALYIGRLSRDTETYDVYSMQTGQTLHTLCLLEPDDRALQRAAAAFPKAERICVGNGEAGTYNLTKGKLYLLNDTAGRAGVYYTGTADVLLLADGFRAADLPVEAFRPDLLVLLGDAEQLELLQPQAAFLLGEETYEQALMLRAKGVQLPDTAEEARIMRAASRGAAWRFSFEAL